MTELTWDGKYKDGKKVAPVRIALPFQTIETINESASDRKKRLDSLFDQKEDAGEWRNRLIWGDKKYVLPSLLPEFAGKIKLIYIDPPFNVGAYFSFTATIPDHPESEDEQTISFTKQPSIIEQKAYRDTWGKGLDSYLQWFYETIIHLRELLTDDGSIYVHLDWHVASYAKVILDEVFGYQNLRNEIIWCYQGPGSPGMRQFNRKHDNIFWYSKSNVWIFNDNNIRIAHNEKTKDNFKKGLRGSGFVGDNYDLNDGKIPEDWWEFAIAQRFPNDGVKRTGYPTEKPWSLLERIIKASSNEGDIVADFFAGSGTTAAVAEKLGRCWITCDLGRFSIHTTRKRLLGITDIKPFVVQNLGKYERQQWMQAEFDNIEDRILQEKAYRKFIIDLYHAQTLEGYIWIHGTRAGRMIHIGSVEAPITVEDIKQTIIEFWKLAGKEKSLISNGIDFLGWDFSFDINETSAQVAAENKIDVKFKKIPREVLEKKAVEQGDIKFYELASLSIETKIVGTQLKINLCNFIIPPDDVPEDVRGNITHWSQWVDYWSIDWNYRDDTFHNEWQSYRTKQKPQIELSTVHEYESLGIYTVLVKVIDILGNDTTKAIEIKI